MTAEPGSPQSDGASGWASRVEATAHLVLGDGTAEVAPGLPDDLEVDGPDGHHLERVRRIRVGERVTVADGAGRWRPYEVEATRPGCIALEAVGLALVEPELRPPLAVAFALTKGAKPEAVVTGLTELGVDRVVVVTGARSVARWRGAQAEGGLDRLRRVARESAMQCRRSRLPRVEGPASWEQLAGHPGLVVADVAGVGVGGLGAPPAEGWLLAVGPEGGFDPGERSVLVGRALAVGPHVLRAETAAVAVAAVLTAGRLP